MIIVYQNGVFIFDTDMTRFDDLPLGDIRLCVYAAVLQVSILMLLLAEQCLSAAGRQYEIILLIISPCT